MIAMCTKNGKMVRLSANYDFEKETASYEVTYEVTHLYFGDFKHAVILYKSLCKEVEMGCDMDKRMKTLVEMYGKEVA